MLFVSCLAIGCIYGADGEESAAVGSDASDTDTESVRDADAADSGSEESDADASDIARDAPGDDADVVEDTSDTQEVSDTESETDTADGDAADGCSGDGTADGCPCTYKDEAKGVCKGQTYKNGECVEPETYVSDEDGEVDPEHCDGNDNDCDGTVDEGCPCNINGKTVGICKKGRTKHGGGCNHPKYRGEENLDNGVCQDSIDNDCDNTKDCNEPNRACEQTLGGPC